jgi:2-oxoglutarate dehydrogenase E2 component (dihydrolipoamide succinyltransferase)
MRIEVVVPQIGEAVSELLLTRWLKRAGDAITAGDVLFEIDSDKAIVEVEAFADGTLTDILYGDNASVMPLQVVAYIERKDRGHPRDRGARRAVRRRGGQIRPVLHAAHDRRADPLRGRHRPARGHPEDG